MPEFWGLVPSLPHPALNSGLKGSWEPVLGSDLVSEWTGLLDVLRPEQFLSGPGLEGVCSRGVVGLDVQRKLPRAGCALRGYNRRGRPSPEEEWDFLMPQPCVNFTSVSGTSPGYGLLIGS